MKATEGGYFSYTFPNIIEDAATTLDPLICHYDALQEVYKKLNADQRKANFEENMKALGEIEKSLDEQLKEINKQTLLNRVIKNSRKENEAQARMRRQLENDADMYMAMRKFRRIQDDALNNNANIFAVISKDDGFREFRIAVDDPNGPNGAECEKNYFDDAQAAEDETDVGEGEEEQLGVREGEWEGEDEGEGEGGEEEGEGGEDDKRQEELGKKKKKEKDSCAAACAHESAVQTTLSQEKLTSADALSVWQPGCGPGDCRERPFVIDDKDECLFNPACPLRARVRARALCCRNVLYDNDSAYVKHLGLENRRFDFDEQPRSKSSPCLYNVFNTTHKHTPCAPTSKVFNLHTLTEDPVGEEPNALILDGSTTKLINKIMEKKLSEAMPHPRKRVKLCCTPHATGCCLNAKREGKYIDHATIKEVYSCCKKNRARIRNITSR